MNETELRNQLAEAGRRLYAAGLVAANDGNISARLPGGLVLATPAGVSKGFMNPDELCVTDMNGKKISGGLNPSSEIKMHLLVYNLRPDINAVVHAHPPTATGFAAAGIALNEPLIAEAAVTVGPIALAPYGTPGTTELTDALKPFIAGHNAALLANHGVVTYGRDVMQALFMMETVEHYARIALVTRMLGRSAPIPACQLAKLDELRGKTQQNEAEEKLIAAITAAVAELRRTNGA